MKAKFAVAVLLTAICISFVRDISHTSHKTKKPLASRLTTRQVFAALWRVTILIAFMGVTRHE
jgi:hypothetical protein